MSNFIDFAEKEMSKKLKQEVTIGIAHDESWDNAPEWAKWKAQNGDGTWYWYKTKPKWYSFGLYAKGTWMPKKNKDGEYIKEIVGKGKTHYISRAVKNSKDTLQKRPAKETQDD